MHTLQKTVLTDRDLQQIIGGDVGFSWYPSGNPLDPDRSQEPEEIPPCMPNPYDPPPDLLYNI